MIKTTVFRFMQALQYQYIVQVHIYLTCLEIGAATTHGDPGSSPTPRRGHSLQGTQRGPSDRPRNVT